MKRLFASLFLLSIATSSALIADSSTQPAQPHDYSFYIKVGSGVSVSASPHVKAPSPPWNQATQGYNSGLGTCAIASFSVGCELMELVDFEFSISNRSTFKYRKFQTPVGGGSSYTRKFDLSVTPILFSVNILGRAIPYLHLDIGCHKFYPIVGGGVGVSNLAITNFRTTGLPPTGTSDPYASFSSENQHTSHKKFTYTVLAGVEYGYGDSWAIGTGYRWFDAGQFKGPRYLRAVSGAAVDVSGDKWKMQFKANEWFIEFKIFI